jgi:hypothetical protein
MNEDDRIALLCGISMLIYIITAILALTVF